MQTCLSTDVFRRHYAVSMACLGSGRAMADADYECNRLFATAGLDEVVNVCVCVCVRVCVCVFVCVRLRVLKVL
jgi:hypothetical protein